MKEIRTSRPLLSRPLLQAAFVAVFAASPGCVGLSRAPYPERTYYVVEVHRETPPRPQRADSLTVRGFRVSPGFETRQLVYATGGGRYESDFYHQFFLPVPVMVTQAATEWIGRSGLFGSVVGTGSLVDSDFVLEGSVRHLFGDYGTGDEPAAVVALQILLLRNEDSGPRVLLQRDYDAREPLSGRDPGELVRGFGAALTDILTRVESDLAQAEW